MAGARIPRFDPAAAIPIAADDAKHEKALTKAALTKAKGQPSTPNAQNAAKGQKNALTKAGLTKAARTKAKGTQQK